MTAAIEYTNPVAVAHTSCGPLIAPGVAGGGASTVVVIELLVTLAVARQFSLEVSTTETLCPSVNEVVVYDELLVPTLVLPIFHWYEGALPPFTGVAVKVTESPGQILLSLLVIVTSGVRFGLTEVVIALLVTVASVKQVSLLLISTVTACPSVNAVVVNVELLVPAFDPLTFH